MEHRYSVRKPVEYQLILYRQGVPVQRGVGRNLGLGGVFVSGGDTKWRRNEHVEAEFVDATGKPLLRLSAMVVHSDAQGVGLMFDALSHGQRQYMRELVLGQKPEQDINGRPQPTGRYAAA